MPEANDVSILLIFIAILAPLEDILTLRVRGRGPLAPPAMLPEEVGSHAGSIEKQRALYIEKQHPYELLILYRLNGLTCLVY